MNIQIFGKSKCFDTKEGGALLQGAAGKVPGGGPGEVRHEQGRAPECKERGGAGEPGGLGQPGRGHHPLSGGGGDKLEKLFENPKLIRTPVVRNGRQATVGYCPDVWKEVDVSRGHGGTFLPLEREIFKKCNRCVNKQLNLFPRSLTKDRAGGMLFSCAKRSIRR